MNLAEVREKVPELKGLDDATAITVLQQTYYPDMSREDVAARLGYAAPKAKQSTGVMRTIADMGVKGAQGVVDLGQSAVGLASLATGGLAGKGMRAIGYDPERANEILGQGLSDEQRAQEAEVQNAQGFTDTLLAAAKNPRAVAGSVVESMPALLGIGGVSSAVARSIATKAAAPLGGLGTEAGTAAGKAAVEAAASKLITTGSVAEGAQSAGSIADQAQGAGRDYGAYALPALAAGAGTALIGRAAGKVMGDAETALFTGSKSAGVQGSLPARVAKAALSEGVLEELPQSAQEQVWTNIALGKPWNDGVGNAAAMGAVTGGVMGAGMGAVSPHRAQQQTAADTLRAQRTVPELGPLSAAANIATEAAARDIENAPPVVEEPPPVDPVLDRLKTLTGRDRQDALHAYSILGRDDIAKGVRQYNSKLLDKLLAKIDEKGPDAASTRRADLLASGMGRDPVQGALATQQDEATSQQNLDNWMARAVAMPIDRAQEIQQAAGERGMPMEVIPHSNGQGFTLVPTDWVAPSMRNQTGAALPLATAPTGVLRADAAGTVAPETKAQRISTNQAVQDVADKRAAKAEIGLTPDVEAAQRARTAAGQSAAAPPASPPSSQAGAQAGDILAKSGKPFASRLPASNAAKKAGADHEVVPVEGGFAVRKKAEWHAFPEHTGTLGIARGDMPQIKSEHHGPLVNFLNARGITHETVEVDASSLKPTQSEYSPAKAEGMAGADGERSILVSSDNHVLDGHHQWLAAGANDEPVKVIRLNAPIKDLLPLVKEFPSATTADAASAVPAAAEPESKPAADDGAGADSAAAGAANADAALGVVPSGGPPAAVAKSEGTPAFHTLTREEFAKQWLADQAKRFNITQAKARVGTDLDMLHRDFIEEALERGDKVPATALAGHDFDASEYPLAAKLASEGKVTKPQAVAAKSPVAKSAPSEKAPPESDESNGESKKLVTKAKIEDFGEKLEGARKDYAAQLKDAMTVDVAAEPLSKSWPEPDYGKLLASGADPAAVAFVHAERDEVPTKPQSSWKLKGWVAQVTLLRSMASKLLSGEVTMAKVRELLDQPEFTRVRDAIGGRAELYERTGHDHSLKGVGVSMGSYSIFRGQHYSPAKIIWTVEKRAKASAFSNWPNVMAEGATREEAIAAFVAKVKETPETVAPAKKSTSWDLWRQDGKVHVGKKVGREHVSLKTFEDVKAAREYRDAHQAELQAALERYRSTPFERRTENQPRVGDDHRAGARVTPEAFAEAFGFRGVQFGNYVENGKRQQDLNDAYDGLMDLAAVLGVPPRALSLNGKLGLAFGARGRGGKNAPSAHFEPGRVVINLTKEGGAGALAHEWFHALDGYFGGGTSGTVKEGTRVELARAFAGVMAAIRATGMQTRSRKLDDRKSKPYWATPDEMGARAFEAYIVAKLQDQSARNDYLANIVDEAFWTAQEALSGREDAKTYPYPTDAEMGPIREAFDGFFRAVETRQEGDNIAMFSRRADQPVKIPPAVVGSELGAGARHADYAAAKAGDAEAAVRLAQDLVTDSMVDKVRALVGDAQAIIVPVVAEEATGRNKIPAAVAEVLASRLGLTAGEGIVQSNRPKRTTLWGLDRIFQQPEFDGPIEPGAKYVLVDDTLTQGGTFAALASHIAQGGGEVIGAVALTGKQYSATLQPSNEVLQALRAKHGDIEAQFRAATGYGFDALTQSEARYLLNFKPALALRARIAAEGRRAGASEDAGDAQASRQGQASGLTPREIQQAVSELTGSWLRKPDIHVLDSLKDAPEAVRRVFESQNSQGATGLVEGFHYRGGVYLVADVIDSKADVARVLFHEALGHFGLRGVFGDELKPLLKQLAAARPQLMARKAGQYGFDLTNESQRLQAAEEVLAELAQTHPELGFVKRAIAIVRAWLRKHMPGFKDLKLSDDEIVRTYILPAREFVVRGKASAPSFTLRVEPAAASRTKELQGEQLQEALEGRGEQILSRLDADRRWGDGEVIYGLHENAEEPHRIRTREELQAYAPDQLMALPAASDEDPMFSRAMDLPQRARDAVNDFMATSTTFNKWWHTTVGTQYHKAQVDKDFKRAFDATQDYILDVSRLANDAADRARDLLPRLESLRDVLKDTPLDKDRTTVADARAIAKPIFQGTLADKRQYRPEELKRVFGLTDKQVELYQQFRDAVNKSVDDLSATTAAKIVRNAGFAPGMIQDEVEQGDHRALAQFAEHAAEQDPKLAGMADQVRQISDRAEELKAEGYAPLMRFGQYAVSLRDPKTKDLQEFYLFENERQANAKARELAGRGDVETSVMSTQDYQLLKGVSPESLELFGDILEKAGLFDTRDEVFQEYLRKAIDQRSAMKRMIHREGFPGYSQDVRRVLATFVTSNARLASKNLHFTDMLEAVENIPKAKGDVRDEATKLVKYVQEPIEEANKIRGLLFVQYIGGNIASAIVNTTQTLTMTYPYLSQFTNPVKAVATVMNAMKAAAGKPEGALGEALARAEQAGVVSPQEIHQLNAHAIGSFGSNPAVQKAMFLWGSLFSLAEQFNRRVAFIAGYETALARKEPDPYAFAVKAVEETQGIYNRGNRPDWARGAVGSTLFTFKQFSISYLEFLSRLPKREKALALAVLMLAAGAEGLPFADDLDDVIDTIAQHLGYNFNAKTAKRRFLSATLGEGASDFLLKGLSTVPGMPIDVSARMGMANLLPGTGVLRKDVRDHMRDVIEFAGPIGGLVQDATHGTFAPTALRNLAKAADMAQMGMYRDEKGRKVVDVDAADAFWKGIGFQPSGVAEKQLDQRLVQSAITLVKQVETELADEIAEARFEKDSAKEQAAREKLRDWNAKNPEARIVIAPTQIGKRLSEMRKTRAERIIRSAPKELRPEVRTQLQ